MIPPLNVQITLRLELPDEVLAALRAWSRISPAPDSAGTRASPGTDDGEGGAPSAPDSSPTLAAAMPLKAEPPPPFGGGASIPEATARASHTRPPQALTTTKPTPTWTNERRAVLARDWPAGKPTPLIMAELMTMPGDPIPHEKNIGIAAAGFGLKRPEGFQSPSIRAEYAAKFAAEAASVATRPVATVVEPETPTPAPIMAQPARPYAPPFRQPPAPAKVAWNVVKQWADKNGTRCTPTDIDHVNAFRRARDLPEFVCERHPEKDFYL